MRSVETSSAAITSVHMGLTSRHLIYCELKLHICGARLSRSVLDFSSKTHKNPLSTSLLSLLQADTFQPVTQTQPILALSCGMMTKPLVLNVLISLCKCLHAKPLFSVLQCFVMSTCCVQDIALCSSKFKVTLKDQMVSSILYVRRNVGSAFYQDTVLT